MPTTVLSMLIDGQRQSLEGQRRLEDTVNQGFTAVHASIAQLRDATVHVRDFDRYRDERAIEWAAAKAQHDKDIEDIKTEAKDRQKEAASFRRWLIGVGSGAAVGLAGVVAGIVEHFH